MTWVDLMIEWALESGRVDLLEATGVRLRIISVMPTRDEFATGRWAPTPASPEDIEAGRAFIGEIDAWHRDQPQSKGRGA